MNFRKDTINLTTGTIEEKRKEIKEYFLQIYDLDERLFDLLKDKKFTIMKHAIFKDNL